MDKEILNYKKLSIPTIACKVILDENDKPLDIMFIEANEAFEKFIGVKKDRTVMAANKVAMEQGAVVDGFCWRDWDMPCILAKMKQK